MKGLSNEDLHRYCSFSNDSVYVAMAIARKKENEGITTNTEVVFREVIKNHDDIKRKLDRLRLQARGYESDEGIPLTFRLYLSVNARDPISAYFNYRRRMEKWAEDLYYGDENAVEKMKRTDRNFISELQRPQNRAEKLFMWDLDDVSERELREFSWEVPGSVRCITETPNGYHVVTTPFNYNNFDRAEDYELKTDGLMMVDLIEQ